MGAVEDAALGDDDPVARSDGDQFELSAAVDLERAEVAGVETDHGGVERRRARELFGVVRLDEGVQAKLARDAHQLAHLRVVEVAK